MERSDALLELRDESFKEIEPKHMDDCGCRVSAHRSLELFHRGFIVTGRCGARRPDRVESLASGCEQIVDISVR